MPLTFAPIGEESIIVGTMGVLYGKTGSVYGNLANAFTAVSGYSFLVFNLLCAPCFAAIGAIKREMNSAKWTWFAVGYQCAFAYIAALAVNQFGLLFTASGNVIGTVLAVLATAFFIFMLFRPGKSFRKANLKE